MSSTALLDGTMDRASEALARMDYPGCERGCLEALRLAREAGKWDYYARILLPLQESRRQRRLIAADGWVRLGSEGLSEAGLDEEVGEVAGAGCMVVTHPHKDADAREQDRMARQAGRYLEVLFVDNPAEAGTWRVRSFRGPKVWCERDAPPARWLNRWLAAGENLADDLGGGSPADWFLDACEALGDAAIAAVMNDADAPAGSVRRVERLEGMLEVVADHELLHQRLADAARGVRG